ncbi:hypothetical protein LUZ61_017681 [Rhynchospora tenuis]|uniref:Reverse transcriptase zinc-binding domain-containing protein n=1 Tax=Rhynchospora tenuis TaxID=198213 RepID=A0AAD6EL74_9POAL|nr:hypothetical protein LUZ61_017681 [Rhynchospora tenuis]
MEGRERDLYLGISIARPPTYNTITKDLILHKLHSKLGGWKRDMLSHARRLTLIKSTLTSLPVHYFSITLFNKGMINSLNKILRKFFWGKEQDKFLTPIVWKKTFNSLEEGGLGIRDLHTFNKALMLKNVWALASNKPTGWVQQLNAKYCHERGLWGTNTTRNCSQLWKDIQSIKCFFKDEICWDLQNGKTVQAQNQPWHHFWKLRTRKDNNQNIHVADLFDEDSNSWRQETLQSLFNVKQCRSILANAVTPKRRALIEDRLIWSRSKSGCYSTKEGYEILISEVQPQQNISFHWSILWNCSFIIPKIKVFLWRTIHNGLITSEKLNKFMPSVTVLCTICGNSTETICHILFKCPMARTTWFQSQLGLKTEYLPDQFLEAFIQIIANQDQKAFAKICSTLWCIWKARNNFLFRGKIPQQLEILHEAEMLCCDNTPKKSSPRQNINNNLSEISSGARVILVDAPWNTNRKTGLGIVCYDRQGAFTWAVSHSTEAPSPFTAESKALLLAIETLEKTHQTDQSHTYIFTDCKNLTTNLRDTIPTQKHKYNRYYLAFCFDFFQQT